jgi:hypothetical protein
MDAQKGTCGKSSPAKPSYFQTGGRERRGWCSLVDECTLVGKELQQQPKGKKCDDNLV